MIKNPQWKCKFTTTPHFRQLSSFGLAGWLLGWLVWLVGVLAGWMDWLVGWLIVLLVAWSVCWSVCHNSLKGQKVTLSCFLYQSTYCISKWIPPLKSQLSFRIKVRITGGMRENKGHGDVRHRQPYANALTWSLHLLVWICFLRDPKLQNTNKQFTL